jgi:hypothetical protein
MQCVDVSRSHRDQLAGFMSRGPLEPDGSRIRGILRPDVGDSTV